MATSQPSWTGCGHTQVSNQVRNTTYIYGARENGVFLILSFYIRFYMVFSVVFKHLYSILHRNFNTEFATRFGRVLRVPRQRYVEALCSSSWPILLVLVWGKAEWR